MKCFSVLFLILWHLGPIGFAGEPEDHVQIVKAMVTAINKRDLNALDSLVAVDVVRHSASTPGVIVTNLQQFKDFLKADIAAVPDSVQEIEMIFAAGDKVALRAIYQGTQTGAMGPFPASGKPISVPFMGILRLESGKIAEIWVEWDNLNALKQMGHVSE